MRSRMASRSVGGSRSMPARGARQPLPLVGHLVGLRLRAGDGVGAAAAFVVVERLVVAGTAQAVDDLVLQHRRQPGAQSRPAAEAGAAGEHGLEDILHRVFGQGCVVQPARGEAHQVGDDARSPRRSRSRCGQARRQAGGLTGWRSSAVARRWDRCSLGRRCRAPIHKDHSQITSARRFCKRGPRRRDNPAWPRPSSSPKTSPISASCW